MIFPWVVDGKRLRSPTNTKDIMSDNRIICHSNKITLVLNEEVVAREQVFIAEKLADLINKLYQQDIKVEDFSNDESCW